MNELVRTYNHLYPLDCQPLPNFWIGPDTTAEITGDAVARGYKAVKFGTAGSYMIRGGHQHAMSYVSRSVALFGRHAPVG